MSNEFSRNRRLMSREQMVLSIFRSRVRMKLEEIKEYYEELEHRFRNEKKRLSDRYKKEVIEKELSADVREQIGEYFSEENYRIDNILVKNFRYSIIVTIYSMIERTLNDLCLFLRSIKKISLGLDDIKGAGIERSKIYLQKVCLIDFPENTHEWKEIQKFSLIRNCIVHAEGHIDEVKSPNKLRNIIKNTDGLLPGEPGYIYIQVEEKYILSILLCIGSFMNKILDIKFETEKIS